MTPQKSISDPSWGSGRVNDPFASPISLSKLLAVGGQGFVPIDGYHIYIELRTTQDIQSAEDERLASQYARVLANYIQFGSQAASAYGVTLLEAQQEVLHFFKEVPDRTQARQKLVEAIQFVYLFTKAAYSELRETLGAGWHGLASSLDGDPTLIIRHSNYSSSSAISLSPASNLPAKRLLSGDTKAGYLDIHKTVAAIVGKPATDGDWCELNFRDAERLPFENEGPDAGRTLNMREIARESRRAVPWEIGDRLTLADLKNLQGWSASAPSRLMGSSVRLDLDGFSQMVAQAFKKGPEAVLKVAKYFVEILHFGDHMLHSTPGAIQLPWAGDCCTTVIPGTHESGKRPAWLEFAMRWQSEFERGAGGLSAALRDDLRHSKARWAAGGCFGETGMHVLVPVPTQERTFLIAAGWAVSHSLKAQNLGKGDDIVTHHTDYRELDAAARSQFRQVAESHENWKATGLNPERLRVAAVDVGKAQQVKPQVYLAPATVPSIPLARPHCY